MFICFPIEKLGKMLKWNVNSPRKWAFEGSIYSNQQQHSWKDLSIVQHFASVLVNSFGQ